MTTKVWVSPRSNEIHRSKECAPDDATPMDVEIRASECSGGYAVVPAPPWYVIGAMCRHEMSETK